MTITETIQSNQEQIAHAFGVPAHMLVDPDRTAVPRYWSLCMTSENHGTVGKAGDIFSHAPGKHERVLVVEVPTPANAPIDRVDLRVLTGTGAARPPMGELVFDARTQHAVGKTVEETVEVPAQWLRNLAQLRPEAYSHDGLVAVTRAFCDTADDYSAGIPPVFAIAPATTGASTARPDWLEYDPADHILTIYGVKYSADLFSGLGLGPVGMSFTILAREDGALTLCRGPVAAQAAPLPVQAAAAPAERIECWSHNEEDFSAKSLGELIDTHELQPGATVWAGEAVHPEPSSLFSTDWVIENMGEAAYDIAGEHGGEDYPNVSDEQVAELEALVVGWITKCAPPTFWTVKNVRPYILTAEDCDDQASTSGERQEGGAS